jgi:methylated-DNA-protein-cysteine methyltransferase-like protein
VGKPRNSRQVGSALKFSDVIISSLNTTLPEDELISLTLPWWRVVLGCGKISPRGNSSSELKQADILRAEGVEVLQGYRIDLESFGWFPDDI